MTKDYFPAKFPIIAHLKNCKNDKGLFCSKVPYYRPPKKIVKTIEKIAIKNIGIKQ